MRKAVAVFGALATLLAMALPAGAKPAAGHATYALEGEARALELAIGQEGLTLGASLATADSTPSAWGMGAGQCSLLGDDTDPEDLPCTESTMAKSRYPGEPGQAKPTCAQQLPPPIDTVVDLKIACGSSRSGLSKSLPFTINSGKVAGLNVTLPVGTVVEAAPTGQLVDQVTETLAPVLDQTPEEVQEVADDLVELLSGALATNAIAAEVGPSSSNITSRGKTQIRVDSAAAGARIGILGIPEGKLDGGNLSLTSDPLENGLVIIEVGVARASASLNTVTADAASAASPALVTVKVRDITKPEPTYVEVSVAPGETVTVLQGTPAESTITAADSTITQEGSTAAAGADAVRLHLLKGVQGGVSLALGRATAAVTGDVVKPAPPIRKTPPEVLPLTGGTDATIPAVLLLLAAGALLVVRRKVRA